MRSLGDSVVPLLVYEFLELGSYGTSDGYYLPGNIQVTICDILRRFRGDLAIWATCRYVATLRHFNSTSMHSALRNLEALLESPAELEAAYEVATGRSLSDDRAR